MISSKRRAIPAMMAGALSLTGVAAFGQQNQPTQQELLDTVRSLQAKVAQLESQQQSTTAKVDAAVVDRTVADVQADAAGRSQLLQATGFTAGYKGGKFLIQSEDGDFSLQPTAHFQFRYVANYRDLDTSDPDGDDAFENGFEIRRMKFGFAGKAFGDFTYKFVWQTNRSGGDVELEDAVVNYDLTDTLSVYAGQYKAPVHHEELVSSSRQLSADRSLVNELLGGGFTDRVQGVGVEYEDGPLYATVTFHDGIESLNTSFRDSPANDTDYGVAGRVEYTVFGDKKGYGDLTALNNKSDMLVVGGGADYTGAESENTLTYTVDAQYENTTGLMVYGAVLAVSTFGHGDAGDDFDYGALVQAGYLLDPKFEVFGRYGLVDLENRNELIHELVVGVNYYIHSHNAKLTADVTFLPNGAPANSGLGILDSDDEPQIVGRLQFQLAI